MNNKKLIIFGLIAIFIIWLIWKNVKGNRAYTQPISNSNTSSQTTQITTSSSGTSSNGSCTNDTVLKKGMSCDRVEWSQYKINQVASQLGISLLVKDSKFGSKTEQAFQKLLGKKTGSWNEVLSKCNQLLHQSVATN